MSARVATAGRPPERSRGGSSAGRALDLAARLPVLLLALACQTSGGPSLARIAHRVNATLEPGTVVLGVGDKIEVRFSYSSTWNQEVEVLPDGSVSLQGVGRIVVAGSTPEKVAERLKEAYAHVFEKPDLAVVVKALGAHTVYVMGEVGKPGELALTSDRRLTLIEALARAGGPRKESAYLAHTLLIRWSASQGKQLAWRIDAREDYWTGPEPLYLQPYDVVFVPNTPIDEVAIWVDNYIRRLIPFPYLIPAPRSP